ncbi:MAG TPA: hypothetical protein EYP62_00210, partial [Kiritimatiellae bacterium]|nr:hypothetical protein [Kiritimatiellia bacterium]
MMGTGRQRLPPIHWVLITIASGLVMAHGVLLPQYARHAHLQPGTRELVPKSWIAIQWHQDARLELDIAAYPFPQSLAGRVRQRCERPLYGLTGHLLLRGLARFWKALDDDFDLSYRVAGWILLLTNLLYLLAAAALQYTAAARWLNPFAALIGTLFLMSMGFVHAYVAVCMTHMYIHVPVALLGFAAVRWYSLRKQSPRRPGRTECAGWGLLFGILYLYKPNVAVVLAVVAVLLLLGNVRLTASFIAALPLAYVTYRIYLHAAGVAYYDHNIQRYQQGVWVLHSLGSLRIHELLREFLLCAAAAPRALWRHFGLALPLAAIGLLALKRHHPEHFRPTV